MSALPVEIWNLICSYICDAQDLKSLSQANRFFRGILPGIVFKVKIKKIQLLNWIPYLRHVMMIDFSSLEGKLTREKYRRLFMYPNLSQILLPFETTVNLSDILDAQNDVPDDLKEKTDILYLYIDFNEVRIYRESYFRNPNNPRTKIRSTPGTVLNYFIYEDKTGEVNLYSFHCKVTTSGTFYHIDNPPQTNPNKRVEAPILPLKFPPLKRCNFYGKKSSETETSTLMIPDHLINTVVNVNSISLGNVVECIGRFPQIKSFSIDLMNIYPSRYLFRRLIKALIKFPDVILEINYYDFTISKSTPEEDYYMVTYNWDLLPDELRSKI